MDRAQLQRLANASAEIAREALIAHVGYDSQQQQVGVGRMATMLLKRALDDQSVMDALLEEAPSAQ